MNRALKIALGVTVCRGEEKELRPFSPRPFFRSGPGRRFAPTWLARSPLTDKTIDGCRSLPHDKNSPASLRSDGDRHHSEL
jgi:hypothetical protein